MIQEKPTPKKDMPIAPRLIALAFGFVLIIGCAFVFLRVWPLDFKIAVFGIGAGGLGADLLDGGIRDCALFAYHTSGAGLLLRGVKPDTNDVPQSPA